MDYTQDPGWQYLKQPAEQLLADQSKIKYDAKKTFWIPDAEEGYVWAEITEDKGATVTVVTESGSERTLKKDECQEMNPPKFLKTEDMSNLSFLNDASVLQNLRSRYQDMLIYTYSGLFCVVINPYKRLPIYTESVARIFMGKRRNEMPPHLFAVSDEAYRNMLQDKINQSMLITGESGAGKTENTKKVIAYFAFVGTSQAERGGIKKDEGGAKKVSLEDQIVQTNPVLEAFGNAKTVRNNNSSRFGKFIRIHFSKDGRVAGCDIEHYLLEKSRVIRQAPGERCYHISYQIMSGYIPDLCEKLLLNKTVKDYWYINQAETTIKGIDDKEEFQLTDEAFDILNFSPEEKFNVYRVCSALLHMGEMQFKQKPRDEQAEPDGTEEAEAAAKMYGVEVDALLNAFCKPRVKVGTEWVNKGQNVEQCNWAKGAMAKGIYNRLFNWLVVKCNLTLDAKELPRAFFIGVLDIAGFEIFDLNSFEQLWINFVNEKLQQFFNHHMFVLEQEEYQREGIQWTFIDFGLDLAACIELIEKPMGIISMLDEECIVPKATDLTLALKLNEQHLGTHPSFEKPKPAKGKQGEAHFALKHYAGTVRYNVINWLEKNKDPLNDTVVAVMKTSTGNKLMSTLWGDFTTQEEEMNAQKKGKSADQGGKKKGKSASMTTVSMGYRTSLNNLMSMLQATHPHFVRCLIPNEVKQSGLLDAALVMHQLTCNGVLEGIRICRKGFPNRTMHGDFRQRYAILAPEQAQAEDLKLASTQMMTRLVGEKKITEEEYRIGHTKVFFKAGILAKMEEFREETLALMMLKLQNLFRWRLAVNDQKRRHDQLQYYVVLQRNIRSWCTVGTWPWFLLLGSVRPLIEASKKNSKSAAETEQMAALIKELESKLEIEQAQRHMLQKQAQQLREENDKVKQELQTETVARQAAEQKCTELTQELTVAREDIDKLERKCRDYEAQIAKLTAIIKQLEAQVASLTQERDAQRREIGVLNDEVNRMQSLVAKLTHEKKVQASARVMRMQRMLERAQEETNKQLTENLDNELARAERLDSTKRKLEDQLSERTDDIERERKLRTDNEKVRRKLETEVRMLHEQLEQVNAVKHDLEQNVKRKEAEMNGMHTRIDEADSQCQRLHANCRQLTTRIEQLEEAYDNEKRMRERAEKLRSELQIGYDEVHQSLEETAGRLGASELQNRQSKEDMSRLLAEIGERQMNREARVSELFNMQWQSLSRLRDMKMKLQSLEHDATNISQFCTNIKQAGEVASTRRYLSADNAPITGVGLSRSSSVAAVTRSLSARRLVPMVIAGGGTSADEL